MMESALVLEIDPGLDTVTVPHPHFAAFRASQNPAFSVLVPPDPAGAQDNPAVEALGGVAQKAAYLVSSSLNLS